MGGTGGRPKGNQDASTRQVRVADDLAEMIGWIVRILGKSNRDYANSAQLLDPMIRAQVESLYHPIAPRVEQIKKKMREVAELEAAEPPSPSEQDPPPPPSRRKRRG
jgi:hypothetical protein